MQAKDEEIAIMSERLQECNVKKSALDEGWPHVILLCDANYDCIVCKLIDISYPIAGRRLKLRFGSWKVGGGESSGGLG